MYDLGAADAIEPYCKYRNNAGVPSRMRYRTGGKWLKHTRDYVKGFNSVKKNKVRKPMNKNWWTLIMVIVTLLIGGLL